VGSELDDRFDASTYAADEPVHLFRCDRYPGDAGDELWIPESIWHRMRLVSAAYNLHLAPLLDGSTDPVFLNSTQVERLRSELRFVAATVDDPLVTTWVEAFDRLAAHRSQGASKDAVGIEFP
jgi:hypothetical protein